MEAAPPPSVASSDSCPPQPTNRKAIAAQVPIDLRLIFVPLVTRVGLRMTPSPPNGRSVLPGLGSVVELLVSVRAPLAVVNLERFRSRGGPGRAAPRRRAIA